MSDILKQTITSESILCHESVHKDIAQKSYKRGRKDRDSQWAIAIESICVIDQNDPQYRNSTDLTADILADVLNQLHDLQTRGPI